MTIVPLRKEFPAPLFPGGIGSPTTLASVVARIDSVPPGSIWTGTISATASTQLTSGTASVSPPGSLTHNQLLKYLTWTLYRNGNAEYTWTGASQLCNVQGFGNDVFTVVGELPFETMTTSLDTVEPVTVTVHYNGYSGDETEVPLTVPFLSTSVIGQSGAANAFPGSVPQVSWVYDQVIPANTAGAFTLIPAAAFANSAASPRLWTASISLSALSGVVNHAGTSAAITDQSGFIYCAASVETLASTTPTMGSANQSLDCRGFPINQANLPVTLVTKPSPDNVRVSSVVYWTYDTIWE